MKRKFVNEITDGEHVMEHFLVSFKEMLITKTGNPYLSLTLQDRTGSIDGKIWEGAKELSATFKSGDFVKVDADVDTYRSRNQLNIKRIRKSEEDEVSLEIFLPIADRPVEEMLEELRSLLESVKNPHLRALLDSFLDDEEFMASFTSAPAARNVHHVYLGGLLEHTTTVVKLCSFFAELYHGVDKDLLLSAAMFHDMGKVSEINTYPSFDYTDEGRLIGHTMLGIKMIGEKTAQMEEFPPSLLMLVEHAVMSHHGLLEMGAVKRPKTMEALILHYADDLDAKVNAFDKIIKDDNNQESPWTQYSRLLERYIFKGYPEENSPDEPAQSDET